MGLSIYVNKKMMNLKFSDALAQYDRDNNGFTRQEFSLALNDAASIFARYIIKITGADKNLFDKINTDKNDIMSYSEISDYIKNEYQLDFNKISKMTLKEICVEADKIYKNRKK